MPPNRQSRAIMADSLLPKDRKKQLMQEITLEPAGERGRGRERGEKCRKRGKSFIIQPTIIPGSAFRVTV